MKTRTQFFYSLAGHPLRGKEFARLNPSELEAAEAFIRAHETLDIDAYMNVLNRVPYSRLGASIRPKQKAVVWGLLLEAASLENLALRPLNRKSLRKQRFTKGGSR